MALKPFITMSEYPITLQWTISKHHLKAFLRSKKTEGLKSDKFIAVRASNVQYFLDIYPVGYNDIRGKTFIFLNFNLGDEKKIEAEWTFSIESAGWTYKLDHIFEKNAGFGVNCCTVGELFDLNKKFIVDGKLIVKVEGIYFGDLWNKDCKDLTVLSDGNEIKVHKCVLAYHSILAAMVVDQPNDKIEIIDFPLEIVEKAVKLCYHRNLVPDFSIEEAILLFKFADKYSVTDLKENLGGYLGDRLTVTNVCEILNAAFFGHSLKLQNKCLDFIWFTLSKKKFVPKMQILEKCFLVTVLNNLSFHESVTL